MKFNMKQESGLTIIEMMVGVGILGIAAMGFSRLIQQVSFASKGQNDLEMRVELFQVLQRVANNVDCKSSAASGSPPAATLNKIGGGVLIPEQGANFGRFSVVVNQNSPGKGFKILAASFASPPDNPREKLGADDSVFSKKKIGTAIWNWEQTGKVISKYFSEFEVICSAGAAVSTIPDMQCNAGEYLYGFYNGGPKCAKLPTSAPPTQACSGTGNFTAGTFLHKAPDVGSYAGLSCGQTNGNAHKCCSNVAHWMYQDGPSSPPSCVCN